MELLNKKIVPTIQQLAVVEMVKRYSFSILTGGAGVGKTTAVKLVLDWAKSENLNIIQAAPTGKAAKRMIEGTGYPASTIHSALGCEFQDRGFVFKANENHPLPCDLLIVDEVSMVDTMLMSDLLRAVDPARAKVLVIGDPGQLGSISPGAILKDLLDSDVPRIELNTIHRNSGGIVEGCLAIRQGKTYKLDKKLDLESDNKINLVHVETASQEITVNAIKALTANRMPLRGYDPIWDVQTISPTNIKTDLSCKNLNAVLQNELNPGQESTDFLFRKNDKIINTKNEKVVKTDGRASYIVNGDMGKIIEVNQKNMIVEFFEPTRIVKLSRASNNLLLAYAVTCHRIQGSESPVVIIPVDRAFSYFCDRRWIYTAISRAKDICITVGRFSAIEKMVNNNHKINRKTMLKEKLAEKFSSILDDDFSDL